VSPRIRLADYIGAVGTTATVESGAILKGPAIISAHCFVDQG
jgi:hypothetical protein